MKALLPRWTIRARLTAIYGSAFLISGAVLLTLDYLLVDRALATRLTGRSGGPPGPVAGADRGPFDIAQVRAYIEGVTQAALDELLLWSTVSLAVVAVLSVVLGWLVAGRVLRPLHRIASTARRLSSENLHERIGLSGPPDELTELGATFDGMLDRLQVAFESQRSFVANASHELRTPLAIQRAAIQVGISDQCPHDLLEVRQQLLDANRRAEQLIDGLLLLARSNRGLDHRQPVRLDTIVEEVLRRHGVAADQRAVTVRMDAASSVVSGDSVLLTHLVSNLVGNAVRHNVEGGSVWVQVGPPALRVTNTGRLIDADELPRLFEPFQRGAVRTSTSGGSGLGLSIVRSITEAHGGRLHAEPRPGGGLTIVVRIPTASLAAVGVKHDRVSWEFDEN